MSDQRGMPLGRFTYYGKNRWTVQTPTGESPKMSLAKAKQLRRDLLDEKWSRIWAETEGRTP